MKVIKSFFKIILEEFVYGGHLLSIGASAIVITVLLLKDLPVDLLTMLVPYLTAQVIYSYNHYKEIKSDTESNPERAKYLSSKYKWIIFTFITYCVSLTICLFWVNGLAAVFIITVVAGGILYTEGLKDYSAYILGFKNYYTSFFWASLIFFVPLYYEMQEFSFFILFFFFVFLRWIVNSAFFDIKDVKDDAKKSLKTFAVVFGKNKTILILSLINLLSAVPLLIIVGAGISPAVSLMLFISIIYGFTYLFLATRMNDHQLRILSYVVVDGEYFFWPLMIIIGKMF